MSNIRLTKEFRFEMAHTLAGYDGACSEIHGHSYILFVTVIGQPNNDSSNPKYGMVMDFGDMKRIVNSLIVERLDHSLVIRRTSDNSEIIDMLGKHYSKIIVTDYQPTCENMVARFAEIISAALPSNISLHSIRLHETATSFAEWFASDNI